MNTEQLIEHLSSSSEDANDILYEKLPKISKKFHRLTDNLAKLLDEVRGEFPDAMFYTTGGDGFSLLLGHSHDRYHRAQQELNALTAVNLQVEGGDW